MGFFIPSVKLVNPFTKDENGYRKVGIKFESRTTHAWTEHSVEFKHVHNNEHAALLFGQLMDDRFVHVADHHIHTMYVTDVEKYANDETIEPEVRAWMMLRLQGMNVPFPGTEVQPVAPANVIVDVNPA